MIGRAGRSQFDKSATALILTSDQDKVSLKYQSVKVVCDWPKENLLFQVEIYANATSVTFYIAVKI